jgi:5-methylcytosine-specific restriction endonuclease McrA
VPILAGKNKKTCSRGCANTHRAGIKYKIGSPKDKVRSDRAIKLRIIELRGSACERCRYDRVEILHIHHRDRNHANNAFSNLELICPNCHYEEHYLEKSWLSRTRLN